MLELRALTVGYGAFVATHELDITVRGGSVFALIGANGAGKSSTILAIAGHVRVLSGRIAFDSADITAMPAHRRIAAGVALAPEGRRLFPDLTVRDNLTIGGFVRPKSEEAANREAVLELFPRLGERLDQRAGTLSGGEQQMLAIGRAMMAVPKLLMIDEVSLGLMPKAVDVCYAALARLKEKGLTLIIVEQNLKRALAAADDICVLESGRIVWSGTAAEARRDPSMIEASMGLG